MGHILLVILFQLHRRDSQQLNLHLPFQNQLNFHILDIGFLAPEKNNELEGLGERKIERVPNLFELDASLSKYFLFPRRRSRKAGRCDPLGKESF